MRDKLIKLIQEAGEKYSQDPSGGIPTSNIVDYLVENGVVVLPCKVGDEVYFVKCGKVLKATVINIELNYFTVPQEWITIEYNTPYAGTQEYKSRIDLMFGKTVFFTKEKAKMTLAERVYKNG